MVNFQKLIVCTLLLINLICKANYIPQITNFLDQYKRPITVLEIGNKQLDYYPELCQKYNESITCVALFLETRGTKGFFSRLYNNLVILNPINRSKNLFEQLGKCEHFDAVIIDNIKEVILDNDPEKTIKDILTLSDYVFFIVNHDQKNLIKIVNNLPNCKLINRDNKYLYLVKTEKKGLELARWTQKAESQDLNICKYPVTSNFTQKLLLKSGQLSVWHKGINLVTFIMLCGIYPTDSIIRANLNKIKSQIPNHNDFVVGNFIVQGTNLIAIDIDDSRRSANIDVCLNAALDLFNGDNRRLKDPKKRIYKYYDIV